MWTCNRLDLQTLGSQPVMPKNLPDHCSSAAPMVSKSPAMAKGLKLQDLIPILADFNFLSQVDEIREHIYYALLQALDWSFIVEDVALEDTSHSTPDWLTTFKWNLVWFLFKEVESNNHLGSVSYDDVFNDYSRWYYELIGML